MHGASQGGPHTQGHSWACSVDTKQLAAGFQSTDEPWGERPPEDASVWVWAPPGGPTPRCAHTHEEESGNQSGESLSVSLGGRVLSSGKVWPGEGREISGSLSFPHLSFGDTVSGPAKDARPRVSARCMVAPRVLTFNSKCPTAQAPRSTRRVKVKEIVAIRPLGVRLPGVETENTSTRGWAQLGLGSSPSPTSCARMYSGTFLRPEPRLSCL